MKTVMLVAFALLLSSVLHLLIAIISGLGTFALMGKSTNTVVLIFGMFYLPFFVCGAILAATKGFPCPRLLSTLGALISAIAFALSVNDAGMKHANRILILASVPCSFAGCWAMLTFNPHRLAPAVSSESPKRPCGCCAHLTPAPDTTPIPKLNGDKAPD
jgi:hypothetical protein